MPSSDSAERGHRRWAVWLAIIIALLSLAYAAAWFYFADRLEGGFSAAIADMNREGVRVECTEFSSSGFPLHVGVVCHDVTYARPNDGMAVAASALRYALPLLRPGHVDSEVYGPAHVSFPPLPPLAIGWEALRAELRRGIPLPENVSITVRALAAHGARHTATPLLSVAAAELEARPAKQNLDVAARLEKLVLDPLLPGGGKLPPLDGEAEVAIENGVSLALDPPRSLRGQSAMIHKLSLSAGGEAQITLSGRVSVDDAGFVNANLAVSVRNPRAVARDLSEAFPKARETIESASAAVAALGDEPTLQIRIVDGEAYMGFVPLGKIPPL